MATQQAERCTKYDIRAMPVKRFQNHFTRTICIAGIFIGLLSGCLGQVPTREPVTITTATLASTALPTHTPSPGIGELQVLDWHISSFMCDKKGTVANVTVEVTAEGGTLPYTYATENFVAGNPPATKHSSPTGTSTTVAPVKKPKNATATPTSTPIPPTVTMAPLLPGQLLVDVQPGLEKITIRSADGQSVTLEVTIPSACADVPITPIAPIGTPGVAITLTSSPQPSPTATMTSLNLPRRPVCSDGLDNDGDGYVDLYDPNCKTKGDQSESH